MKFKKWDYVSCRLDRKRYYIVNHSNDISFCGDTRDWYQIIWYPMTNANIWVPAEMIDDTSRLYKALPTNL